METTQKILNEIKILIFDSNIDKNSVEFGVTYNQSTDYNEYFLKFKDSKNYILKDETRDGFISNYEKEMAEKILYAKNFLIPYEKFIDNNSLGIYWETEDDLYDQAFVSIKNSNILYFPYLKKLVLIKKVKISFGETMEKINFVYKKETSLKTFKKDLEELNILDKTSIEKLLNMVEIK